MRFDVSLFLMYKIADVVMETADMLWHSGGMMNFVGSGINIKSVEAPRTIRNILNGLSKSFRSKMPEITTINTAESSGKIPQSIPSLNGMFSHPTSMMRWLGAVKTKDIANISLRLSLSL